MMLVRKLTRMYQILKGISWPAHVVRAHISVYSTEACVVSITVKYVPHLRIFIPPNSGLESQQNITPLATLYRKILLRVNCLPLEHSLQMSSPLQLHIISVPPQECPRMNIDWLMPLPHD